MCLVLPKKVEDPTDVVYKIYSVAKEVKRETVFDIKSLWRGTTVEGVTAGTVIKSNRRSVRLTRDEISNGTVDKGLHVFLCYEDALRSINRAYIGKTVVAVRCLGKRSKRVAVGTWEDSKGTPNAVYTELTVDAFIAVVDRTTGKQRNF